jgi:hypothetical protein
MQDLAGRLIAEEITKQKPSPEIVRPPAFFVCEKLGPQLMTLMGRGGYQSLLSRALELARKDVDWLRAVVLTEMGALSVADDVLKQMDAKEMATGSTMLVAELLGLLVAFIGDNLTLRLVRDVWPTLSLEYLDFTKGDKT